jgi:hypothetical protein
MGACCTAEFLHKCPANPRRCSCGEHADCAPGWFCSDAVPPGGAWTCLQCGSSTSAMPAARRDCPALGSRCCGRDYLRQCPDAPHTCPCSHHDDCVRGMYCAQSESNDGQLVCVTCTAGVNTTVCASFDTDCCSAVFLRHCDDPLFPRTNVFVPETNPRVDPHECRRRMVSFRFATAFCQWCVSACRICV